MNYRVTDTELTSIAAAIRQKLSTAQYMRYQSGFVDNIHAINTYPISALYTSFPDIMGWAMGGSTLTSTMLSNISVTSSLVFISWNSCSTINSEALYSLSTLREAKFSNCSLVCSNAFCHCKSLKRIIMHNCRYIEHHAFYECRMSYVSFPVCSYIGNAAFQRCFSLVEPYFPACTYIGIQAFSQCNFFSAFFPACTSVDQYAFAYCPLRSVYFPACNYLYWAFASCTYMQSANLPVCETVIGGFFNCTSLSNVSLPRCSSIGQQAFYYCSQLSSVSLPSCSVIGSLAFTGCTRLTKLFLMGSYRASLSYSNAFSSTPIGGYSDIAGEYGSIYVPSSLLSQYQTATNWVYFSSRFVGI